MTDTRSRLEDIARRVRVIAMDACDFDGRLIAAPPPLPRRFPPVPLIDRLQTELYARAYCVPLGHLAEASQGEDLLAALAAANVSRSRIDPGWLIREVDGAGAIIVSKRGVTRRIPASEIFQEPGSAVSAPHPGRLVTIVLPREQPDQGGFYFSFGEAVDSSLEGRPAFRFYWNIGASHAPALMRTLTKALNVRSIPFSYKCLRNAGAYGRADAGTLFILARWLEPAAAAVHDVWRDIGSELAEDVPLFSLRLAPGLGFAQDPGSGESFGMVRTRLLAEGLWVAFARGATAPEAVMDAIQRHFLENGVDMERPHLNPWSTPRYDLKGFE